MEEPFERLQEARRKAGYTGPTEAAEAFGWKPVTYMSHENGTRGLRPDVAERYGRAFRVPSEWLLFGKESGDTPEQRRTVPLVGYVRAGAEAHLYEEAQGPFGEVPAPEGATESTVAVEVRGESLGALFDRWIIYYDDVRRPVTADLIGHLCVVGVGDGRILVKRLQRSKSKGLFHLISQTEPPILDVPVRWAAKVKSMAPQ